jgi:pyridoxal phosphate enzyme (YggS family)
MVDEAAITGQAALAERLASVKDRVAAAAGRSGRDASSITLVAVSKTYSAQVVAAAEAAGQRVFGENRLEEAAPKMLALTNVPVRWHMVGHVQSRKAADVAAAGFELVHSVDGLRLAERLSRAAQALGRRQAVLLECNVSGESSKAGFSAHEPGAESELLTEVGKVAELPGLEVRGLMTMAPIVARPELARPFFERLADLRDYFRAQLSVASWSELSMGMTDDFEVAIECGATLVRVGRAIFGERT